MSLLTDRRRYDVACPIACALDTVGERWTLLILRELLPGPLRFSELKAAVPGINATILSRRLDQLRDQGILSFVGLSGTAVGYGATERAESLWPILLALARWGAEAMPGIAEGLTPAAAVVAFLALRPAAARAVRTGFTLQGPRLEWQPEARFPLMRTEGLAPAEVEASPQTLLDLALGRLSAEAALEAGRLRLTGPAGALFLDNLPLQPEPVGL